MDAQQDTKLSGEGEVQFVRRERVRRECGNCGEPAVYRWTYLLKNYRSNPQSSAYRQDDCSYCSDHDVYSCAAAECKPPHDLDGYSTSGPGRWEVHPHTAHMFLEWRETNLPDDRLTVSVCDDGVWLAFQPKNGVPAMVRVDAIAEPRGPITRRIILAWADERRAARTPATER